jgi:hypothetical protein
MQSASALLIRVVVGARSIFTKKLTFARAEHLQPAVLQQLQANLLRFAFAFASICSREASETHLIDHPTSAGHETICATEMTQLLVWISPAAVMPPQLEGRSSTTPASALFEFVTTGLYNNS